MEGETTDYRNAFDGTFMSIIKNLNTEKINSKKAEKILDELNDLKNVFTRLERAYTELRIREEVISEVKGEIQATVKECIKNALPEVAPKRISYAQVTSTEHRAPAPVPPAPVKTYSVLIYPGTDSKEETSDDTKETLTKCVRPSKLGIQIEKVVRIGNKGVCLESSSPDLARKIEESTEFKNTKLVLKVPEKRKPRMCVIGVRKSVGEDELISCIKVQSETENSEVRVVFPFGKKESSRRNWVVEVDAETRKALLNSGRVYVDYDKYRVSEYIQITRCFKCQGHGHLSKDCRKEEACSICAGTHSHRDCTNKGEPKCVNCLQNNETNSDHQAVDPNCPVYKRKLANFEKRIDYG